MSKRSLSPAQLPPAKRLHVFGSSRPHAIHILSFENSLYDELILCIFSYLSWFDLCTTQATSRNWARLAADNELWREQYLKVYGRTRLRGAKGFFARLGDRDIKPLPGRAIRAELHKDWKWMFRISSNWRNGRCSVEECLDHSVDPPAPEGHVTTPSNRNEDHTHIILAGALIITASSKPTHLPKMIITTQSNQHHTISCYEKPLQDGPASITALALDQSPPPSGLLSISCFLSTGEFFVFEFNPSSPSHLPTRKYTYQPSRRNFHTFQAVYYHPLLVTVSDIFSLSIFDLSSGNVRLAQTLTSFTSYPPASLVLSASSSILFKLVVAYSIPVYPRHWSVGATELMISKRSESSGLGTSSSSSSFREDYRGSQTSTMVVITTRTIRAFDVPSGFVDQASLRTMREQWGRKLLNVADTQTDGKWVIIAPGPGHHLNTRSNISPSPSSTSPSSSLHSPTGLQLYRLVLPAQSSSVSASPPKLNFVRTLHGHTSPVSSLALADGRCVSLGLNGNIRVWDLEAGTSAEVAPADETMMDGILRPEKGSVSFDERRIVTARSGKVVIRRFDI
ncbi:hypothetical protein CPB84DRAFT_1848003 [Gymnopilus junonius]|uniref:F-box domain-containing protein n=1 Tax=Gymnopilus junonius TaxID=109634 RepID=A0A9P5TL91_GYMJU|nr:hypothetical protein CPB84DRAFT_1848003 [Gymnopilus junonius]